MEDTKKEWKKFKIMSSENTYLNNQYKGFFEDSLSKTDPELFKAISDELKR